MARVLIIGLDGGTFDLIKPWVSAGRLPVLAKLLENGAHASLSSTIPPMTFPAWNAFMTGKNPGKHGVFDFTERQPNSYQLTFTNALNRKARTIWQLASDHGKSVATIGVPVTYPPEKVNGLVISGFDAPGFNKKSVYPAELYDEITRNVGEYVISPDIAKYIDSGQFEKAVATILTTLRQNAKIADYVLKKNPWDCFMVVFKESDIVCHHFWHYHDRKSPHAKTGNGFLSVDPVLMVYEELDRIIGALIDSAGEDTVTMIVSDHGFGGTGDTMIYVNKWLKSKGLLAFKNQAGNSALLGSIGSRVKAKVFAKLKTLGTRIIPVEMRKKLSHSKSFSIVHKVESSLRFSNIDWGKTCAYSEETAYYPTIWINLKGREPDGIVEPEDYDALRNLIIAELCAWQDPDGGNRLVRHVFKREEIYHGNYLEKAPDLIIDWNLDDDGYAYLSRPSYSSRDDCFVKKMDAGSSGSSKFLFGRSGSHREQGIFLVSGPMIKRGHLLSKAGMTDVAPTVLHLLGAPVSDDIDGEVLKDIFVPDFLVDNPIRYTYTGSDLPTHASPQGDSYTEEEKDKIKERLKGLGYIE